MGKLLYEKPIILIEKFIPTQCVASTCEYSAVDVPEAVKIKPNDSGCIKKKDGHRVINEVLRFDKNSDGYVAVFTDALACELRYDVEAENDIQKLGTLINGTGCFSSDQHKMMIGQYQVFS